MIGYKSPQSILGNSASILALIERKTDEEFYKNLSVMSVKINCNSSTHWELWVLKMELEINSHGNDLYVERLFYMTIHVPANLLNSVFSFSVDNSKNKIP